MKEKPQARQLIINRKTYPEIYERYVEIVNEDREKDNLKNKEYSNQEKIVIF